MGAHAFVRKFRRSQQLVESPIDDQHLVISFGSRHLAIGAESYILHQLTPMAANRSAYKRRYATCLSFRRSPRTIRDWLVPLHD